jgi:hypothetical protein
VGRFKWARDSHFSRTFQISKGSGVQPNLLGSGDGSTRLWHVQTGTITSLQRRHEMVTKIAGALIMQHVTLTIDDQAIEKALYSIAQKEGKNIADVIMSAIVHFVMPNKTLTDDNLIEHQMSLMASDPQIQSELKKIENEFSITESDGLLKNPIF